MLKRTASLKRLCSAQLSTKFQMLIKTKILTNNEVYCLKSLNYCIYHVGTLTVEHEKKTFITSRPEKFVEYEDQL